MRHSSYFLLLLVSLSGSCEKCSEQQSVENVQSNQSHPTTDTTASQVATSQVSPYDFNHVLGHTPRQVLDRFGAPMQSETLAVIDPNTDLPDSIFRYTFHRTKIAINQNTITELFTQDMSILSRLGIFKDVTIDSIRSVFGRPDTIIEAQSDTLTIVFGAHPGVGEHLWITYANGKIQSIKYYYVLD